MPTHPQHVRQGWPVRACGFALALVPALAGAAGPVRYELDPVHTRVLIAVEHAGFSKALGTISGSSGVLVFDPDDWTTAQLRASVPLARLDLGDAAWNRAALADGLLDADDHPLATFVSTRIEPVDATHAAVLGMLTLHGVTREVRLDVQFNALKRHPLPPFRRTGGFSATTTVSRSAFGIDAWPTVIGDRIELRIEAEAVRARGPDPEDIRADPAPPESIEATGPLRDAEPAPLPQPEPETTP